MQMSQLLREITNHAQAQLFPVDHDISLFGPCAMQSNFIVGSAARPFPAEANVVTRTTVTLVLCESSSTNKVEGNVQYCM